MNYNNNNPKTMYFESEKLSPRFYGISLVPKNLWIEYGYILINISGSDGEASNEELEWLTVSCANAVGVANDIVKKWEQYDFEENNLEELFVTLNSASFGNFNKLLIYDAIRMASADGDYADDEKAQVYYAAKIMKVSPEAVTAIEALIELEQAAEKLRLTIL